MAKNQVTKMEWNIHKPALTYYFYLGSSASSSSSGSGSTAGSGRGPPSSSSVRMPVQNTNNRTNVHQFISQAGDSGHETLLSDDDSPTPAVERASSEVIYSTIANG